MSTPSSLSLADSIDLLQKRYSTLDSIQALQELEGVESSANQFVYGIGTRKIGGQLDTSQAIGEKILNAGRGVFGMAKNTEDYKNELLGRLRQGSLWKTFQERLSPDEFNQLEANVYGNENFLKDPEGVLKQEWNTRVNQKKAAIQGEIDKRKGIQLQLQTEAESPLNKERLASSQAQRALDQKRFGLESQRFGLEKASLGLKKEELGLARTKMKAEIADTALGRRMQAAEMALQAGDNYRRSLIAASKVG